MVLALVSAIAFAMMMSLLRPTSPRLRLTHRHSLVIRVILRRNRSRLWLMLLLIIGLIIENLGCLLHGSILGVDCCLGVLVAFGAFATSGFGHTVGALAGGRDVIAHAMGYLVARGAPNVREF